MRDCKGRIFAMRNCKAPYFILSGCNALTMEQAGLQGASLGGAGLQSANLKGADLRGTKVWMDYLTPEKQLRRGPVQDHQLFSRASVPTFVERIRKSIDQETDTKLFFEVKFEGGLSNKQVDSLAEGLL